jgi:hypothetical protein
VREFKRAARDARDIAEVLPGGRPIKFLILDREVTASPPPNSGPIGYLVAMQSQDADAGDQAFAVLQFLTSLMAEEDSQFVRRALAVGDIDFEVLFEVFEYLMEEWSHRPTASPSGSSPRRRAAGRSSTAGALSVE